VWEYGNFAHRNSKTVASLAVKLGLSEDDLDELFKEAANLAV